MRRALGHPTQLVVQRDVGNRRVDHLARARVEAHDAQLRGGDLLGELVDGDVRGRADEHRPMAHLHQMVHNGRAGHRLAGARRALDGAKRALQRAAHGEHLRVVQLGQPGRREALRQRAALDEHVVHLVPEQLLVQVARDAVLVYCQTFERPIHPANH